MKRFLSGRIIALILGLVGGAAGTVTWLVAEAHGSELTPLVELHLQEPPIGPASDLAEFLEDQPYEIGFFAKHLKYGTTTGRFADRSVCLASMAKVFCLTELYRQTHEESLDLSTTLDVPNQVNIPVSDAADLTIGQSVNAATQALVEHLGRSKVNRIPSLLGFGSMNNDILPSEGVLRQTLDKRVFGNRIAAAGLPQHGTAKDMAGDFELLLNKKMISESISEDLIEFFTKHPKPFSTHYAGTHTFVGKGGNILWTRPPKHYSMMGWALFVTTPDEDPTVLCVWGEWFPRTMAPAKQSGSLQFVTDSLIRILES